jgi:hypothetical protein
MATKKTTKKKASKTEVTCVPNKTWGQVLQEKLNEKK